VRGAPYHVARLPASVRRAGTLRGEIVSALPDNTTDRGKTGGHPNRKRLREARTATVARRSAAPIDANPVDVIQETLDGLVEDLRFTQRMVDGLPEEALWRDTMVGRIPNEWIRLRDEYRTNAAALAGSMITRGIAERAVNVRAAQAALMATMVKEAMRRAGLPQEAIRSVGEELRTLAEEAGTG